MANPANLPAGIHETATVEELIRYAHTRFDCARIVVSASKTSRLVRKVYRSSGASAAKLMVDGFIARDANEINLDSWATMYADPTGNTAAHLVDRENAAVELMRKGHSLADAARAVHLWEVADAQY